jgi:hypothetical protein
MAVRKQDPALLKRVQHGEISLKDASKKLKSLNARRRSQRHLPSQQSTAAVADLNGLSLSAAFRELQKEMQKRARGESWQNESLNYARDTLGKLADAVDLLAAEFKQLAGDVKRRRKENHDERKRANWSMREVDVAAQHEILNFVEKRLAQFAASLGGNAQ